MEWGVQTQSCAMFTSKVYQGIKRKKEILKE